MTCEAHSTVVDITPAEAPDKNDFDVEEARGLQSELDWATHEYPDFHLGKRLPPRRDDEPVALANLRDVLDEVCNAWGEVLGWLDQAAVTAAELVAEMEDAG